MRIEILLSVYNGEKYLPDLLQSLMNQRHDDFHITARDDGSRDKTPAILRSWAEREPGRVNVLPTERNLGYPDCFWTLLANAPEADLYAFCDQDDIWDPVKLSCCEEMCTDKQDRPMLYVHDYRICDEKMKPYGEYHMDQAGYRQNRPLMLEYYVMTSGFTMVLNRKMRERVLRDKLEQRGIEHDRWLFWCGFFCGEIVYDRRMLVDYRRHETTATQTGKGVSLMLREWWKEDVKGNRMRRWSRTARFFADCYGTEMKTMGSELECKWRIVAGEGKGVGSYIRRLCFPAKLKPTLAGELVLRLCFLLNKK